MNKIINPHLIGGHSEECRKHGSCVYAVVFDDRNPTILVDEDYVKWVETLYDLWGDPRKFKVGDSVPFWHDEMAEDGLPPWEEGAPRPKPFKYKK